MKKRLFAMLLTVAMLFSTLPQPSFAEEKEENAGNSKNTYEITQAMLNQVKTPENRTPVKTYDTFYYEAENENNYTYNGQPVSFLSDKTATIENIPTTFQSKKVSISTQIDKENKKATITFDGLTVPIDVAKDANSPLYYWNSRDVEYQIIYDTDMVGVSEVRSENKNLTTLVVENLPESGSVVLSGGKIFESTDKSNWYVGLDLGDGNGIVKARTFCTLPDITLTLSSPDEKPTRDITSDEMKYQLKSLSGSTPADMIYDTFYYTDDYVYTFEGKAVTFTDEDNIQVEGEEATRKFQNKKVGYLVEVDYENDQIVVTFDVALNIPIGQATDKKGREWNSSSRNYNIEYETNIPEISTVKSEDKNLTSFTIKGIPANGAYSLTNGKIYERGSDERYHPQMPMGCLVLSSGNPDGTFSVLPDINLTVEGSENLGFAKLSIERRTIGKGDILSAKNIAIPHADATVKDILDTVAEQCKVSYTQVGEDFLISSIDGDGSSGSGGWRFQVNGEFSNTAINQSDSIKSDDEIRVRYAVSAQAEELKKPLFDYLKAVIADATSKLSKGNYTLFTKKSLEKALADAQTIIDDSSYNSAEADKELAVSKEILAVNTAVKNLKINQDDSSEDSQIPLDFENDLWLQYDFKQMKTGETATIYPRRVPQVVNDVINNDVARPSFNFAVVSGDSVSIKEVKISGRNDSAEITAVKNGITVVKITYDALEYKGKTYGASSAINTAYAVYEVNDTPASLDIKTDITLRSYDTVYFDKGESVDFPFTASADGAKSIKVTCNDEVLTKNADGKYIARLKNKGNIIGVTTTDSGGKTKTFHQVIDARKIQIDIANKTSPDEKLKINDTAIVSFTGITPAIYKLAAIYNPTWRNTSTAFGDPTYGTYVEYHNEHFGKLEGIAGQFDLATNNDFEVTFDKEGTFVFGEGKISTDWWGEPLGSDKDIVTLPPNIAADVHRDKFSLMPDFTIAIGDEVSSNVPVKGFTLGTAELDLMEGQSFQLKSTITPENATDKTILWNSDGRYFATVDESGKITAHKASTDNVPEVVITAKTADGGFVASCKVVVRADPNQSVDKTVQNLINDIDKLFPVSLRSSNAIALAKSTYNRLTAEQKKKITNISLLFEAESRYLRLRLEQDRNQGYESNWYDEEAANEVSKLIDTLGNITADSRTDVETAIKRYNALTSAQKRLVKNISLLFQAENNLLKLEIKSDAPTNVATNEQVNQSYAQALPTINLPTDTSEARIEVPKSTSRKTIDVSMKINDKLPLLNKDSAEISTVEQKALLELASEYVNLPEEQRLLVGNSADIEGFIEKIRTTNQQDSKTGIKVDGADWFVGLRVESPTSSPKGFKQVKEMEEAIGDNKMLSAWDISLSNILEDREYYPDEPVKISIPVGYSIKDENVCVLHYKNDGTIEYIDVAVSDSAVSFETSEFSYYALVSYADGASPFDLNSTLSGSLKPVAAEKTDMSRLMLFGVLIVMLNGLITFAIMFVFRKTERKKKEQGSEK